tara:strand:+ start:210 stop:662 length:453 start_codon:yes stop_codon:yes gene_type:complete
MNEIEQKNCVLIGTCIIVIFFHFAYKFRENKKACNILLGLAFVTSLIMTKLLHGWEKENKVDYNLVLFLYILLDIIVFCFLSYRFISHRNLLRGGGEPVDTNSAEYIIGEFKKQDFWVRLLDNPIALKYLNIFKDKVTNNLAEKLNFVKY